MGLWFKRKIKFSARVIGASEQWVKDYVKPIGDDVNKLDDIQKQMQMDISDLRNDLDNVTGQEKDWNVISGNYNVKIIPPAETVPVLSYQVHSDELINQLLSVFDKTKTYEIIIGFRLTMNVTTPYTISIQDIIKFSFQENNNTVWTGNWLTLINFNENIGQLPIKANTLFWINFGAIGANTDLTIPVTVKYKEY